MQGIKDVEAQFNRLTKAYKQHVDSFPHEMAKVEAGIQKLAISKRSALEDELAVIAKRIQKNGETYEAAFVRGLDTEEGKQINQALRQLYVDHGV